MRKAVTIEIVPEDLRQLGKVFAAVSTRLRARRQLQHN